jgi:hypothetical protein
MKKQYIVTLRDDAGEEHTRSIFANDETAARERAVARARIARGKTMKERRYGRYEVLSCEPATREAHLLAILQ